jgi:hypothetical protein
MLKDFLTFSNEQCFCLWRLTLPCTIDFHVDQTAVCNTWHTEIIYIMIEYISTPFIIMKQHDIKTHEIYSHVIYIIYYSA